MSRNVRVLLVTAATASAALGCGRWHKSSPSSPPANGAAGGSGDAAQSALVLGQALHFSGGTLKSDNPLTAPFTAELDSLFTFSLKASTTLKVAATDISWAAACGKTGGPAFSYGKAGGTDFTALPDGVTTFPDPLAAGDYQLLVVLESETACTLTGATLTLSQAQ